MSLPCGCKAWITPSGDSEIHLCDYHEDRRLDAPHGICECGQLAVMEEGVCNDCRNDGMFTCGDCGDEFERSSMTKGLEYVVTEDADYNSHYRCLACAEGE